MPDSKFGLMEEYRSLRDEIMKRQEARQLTIGFTVTAVATTTGLSLSGIAPNIEGPNLFVLALVGLALALVVAALLLTIHHTQHIDLMSTYIRHFVESEIPGIRWESRWTLYRKASRSKLSGGGLPMGTSKPLAFFYALMTLADFSVLFVTGLYSYWYAISVLSGLALLSLSLSFDLYFRKSRGWKTRWDLVDQEKVKPC